MNPLFDAQTGCSASALSSIAVDEDTNATIGRWRHGDAEPRLVAGDGLIKIVVNLSADHRVERLRHGVWTSKPFDIFSFSLVPPDEEFRFSVRGRADILQIFLPEAVAADGLSPAARPMISPRFQAHDPGIERYALQLMGAVQQRCSVDDLQVAELIAGLGDLLANDARRQSEPVSGGIAPHLLRRVLDMMSAAIEGPDVQGLSLADLAGAAGLSAFHFARAFRQTVGSSPCGYVMRKRLERARGLLATSSWPVAEIGRRSGFRSHAHFSSQFRRQMGMAPSRFRQALHL